jgi:small subunit ribosomal protein S5
VLELGGVRDVLTKSIGTQNPINLVKATMDGIVRLRRPEEVAELRGLSVNEVLGLHLTPASGNGAPAEGADPAAPGRESEGQQNESTVEAGPSGSEDAAGSDPGGAGTEESP